MTTTPDPATIEIRKWCIETALDRCEDVEKAPELAAELIALLETGHPWMLAGAGRSERKRGGPVPLPSIPFVPASERDDPAADDGAGVDDPVNRADDTAEEVDEPLIESPIDGPLAAPTRSIPRMPPAAPTIPDGPELSEKEQAVLIALTMLAAPGDFPKHAQIAEASGVPRGSLAYVLERLLEKGYLARPDGKWAVVDKTQAKAAE